MGHDTRKIEFLVGHALLRVEAGQVLNLAPSQVPLDFPERQKPRLNLPHHFVSVSHRGGLVACALAPGPVGIDVEIREDVKIAAEAVRNYFSDEEKREFELLEEGEKGLWFNQHWALKEAFFKAADFPVMEVARKTAFKVTRKGEILLSTTLEGVAPHEWNFLFSNPRADRLLALACQSQDPFEVVEKDVTFDELIEKNLATCPQAQADTLYIRKRV